MKKFRILRCWALVSNDLTWNIHVDNIVSKAGKRLYMLYQLKRGGISQRELVHIYIAIIRPVLEYACPVWNTCLPLYLSEAIEMIQKRALRSTYPVALQRHPDVNQTSSSERKTRRIVKDIL